MIRHPLMLLALCMLLGSIAYAQQAPSQAVVNKLREIYNKASKPEVSFEQFLESNRHVYEKTVNSKPTAQEINDLTLVASCAKIRSFCSNGDFEIGNFSNGLDTTQWLGAYGTWTGSSEPDPASLTNGFLLGPLMSSTSHHTVVIKGTDFFTGLPLPGPNGGTKALRLGNSGVNSGTEIIGKTITVSNCQTVFDFNYAVVFQDANHAVLDQPWFSVRVFDCATGAELNNVCDLGNGSNRVISNAQNPFFQDTLHPLYGLLAYRNWSRGEIDLSQHVGKTVTIYFTNKDCAEGSHFGYTYLDNICLTTTDTTCPVGQPCLGFINRDPNRTDSCGIGQICVKYGLPRAGTQTGNITIDLGIYQNGVKVRIVTSPTLTQDSSYCFSINPASLGLNASLGGFDYVIIGRFAIGATNLDPSTFGNPLNGRLPGQNNDYSITCGGGTGSTPQCCPGTNLIVNPGFEQGNTGFTSGHTYQPLIAVSSVLPGYYTVANSAQATIISGTWAVNCPTLGNHLLVNGLTGLTGKKLAWKQDVTLTNGKKYKFCVAMRNLPQVGFDVKPRVTVRFDYLTGGVTYSDSIIRTINILTGPCDGELIEYDFDLTSVSGTGLLGISILLDQSGLGDGNDLVVDNLSLTELGQLPASELLFNLSFLNISVSTFGILADPIAPTGAGCLSTWEIAEVNSSYAVIPGTQLNSPVWANANPNNFRGYVGTSTLGDTAQVGIFQLNKRYRIVYSRKCSCSSSSVIAIVDPVGSGGNLQNIRVISDAAQAVSINSPTGVQNLKGESTNAIAREMDAKNLNVYPNPAKNNVTVAFAKAGDNSRLVIYNVNGGIVKEVQVKSGIQKTDVNTSTLPAGTYFIKLFSNNKMGGSKVFVKQ